VTRVIRLEILYLKNSTNQILKYEIEKKNQLYKMIKKNISIKKMRIKNKLEETYYSCLFFN
jgi:hypothetical protein